MKSYKLNNDFLEIEVLDYGATLKSIKYLNGINLILSLDPDDYPRQRSYLGQIVGRYANRIENARFKLNETLIQLSKNEKSNHLHGGFEGIDRAHWNLSKKNNSIICQHLSRDGDEGYPGEVLFCVEYMLIQNQIVLNLTAQTNKKTIINPTTHIYFDSSLFDQLDVYSDEYLEVCNNLIPTGKVLKKRGRISPQNEKWDHCFIFKTLQLKKMAKIFSNQVEVLIESTLPGLQVYTGDYLDPTFFPAKAGFCLEPQFYPNSPNEPSFPNCFFDKDINYSHQIIYTFNK